MSTCQSCAEAERNPLTGLYNASCIECSVRALAQHPAHFRARALCKMTPEYVCCLADIFGPDAKARDAGHMRVKAWANRIDEARIC